MGKKVKFKCHHCDGKGYIVKEFMEYRGRKMFIYNMIKLIIVKEFCDRCNGKGYIGSRFIGLKKKKNK